MVLQTSESVDNPPEVCKLHAVGNCRAGTECKLLHEFGPETVGALRDIQLDIH